MSKTYYWLNREKSRYYVIEVSNDIVIEYAWGGCHNNRGGKKKAVFQSEAEVDKILRKMMNRRKSRGYELIAPS